MMNDEMKRVADALSALRTPAAPEEFDLHAAIAGALTAAVGWSIFSWAFSAWVSATGSYGTYGSLVTVVVVMLWLYYCQYILLLSACLNRALPKFRRRGETEPASEPEPSEE